jgi:hypothetical protein
MPMGVQGTQDPPPAGESTSHTSNFMDRLKQFSSRRHKSFVKSLGVPSPSSSEEDDSGDPSSKRSKRHKGEDDA